MKMRPYANGGGPTDARIRQYVADGYDAPMLADLLGVNVSTVRYYIRRAGVSRSEVDGYMTHEKFLPWRMSAEDSQDEIARVLRFWSQQDQGQRLKPAYIQKVNRLRAHLERYDRVITYSRNTGFRLVPRQPTDNPDLPVRP